MQTSPQSVSLPTKHQRGMMSLKKAANNAHKAWRNAGKPRNPDHPLRIIYKDSKLKFRAKLRNHHKNLRELFFSKLDLANTD